MEENTLKSSKPKKVKMVTAKMKNLSKSIRRDKDRERKSIKKIETKKKLDKYNFIGKTERLLTKPTFSKRYKIQQKFGNIPQHKRDEHHISRYEELSTKYDNLTYNREIENIETEHLNRDKNESLIRLAELSEIKKNFSNRGMTIEDSDPFTSTSQITQDELITDLDLNTQKKIFDIELFGQGGFHIRYNSSGRNVMIAGMKGSLSSLKWRTFECVFEMNNIGNRIDDVTWIMDDSLIAVSFEKFKTKIFDGTDGSEVHCIHDFKGVKFLQYLPYHFLLVGGSPSNGRIIYKDISVGKTVATVEQKSNFSCMTQNGYNGIICVGNTDGTVDMISPRDGKNEPLMSILCHKAGIRHILIDTSGKYMVTNSIDGYTKTFDIRKTFKALSSRYDVIEKDVSCMSISGDNMIAMACGSSVKLIKNVMDLSGDIYMKHSLKKGNYGKITSLKFCPYEEVLGIGWTNGFSSIIIPGSGSAQIDSRIPNPYFTEKQLKNWNVNSLLEKVPWEMICIDPNLIASSGKVKTRTLNIRSDLKEELQEINYHVKGEEDEYTENFFALRRDQRREVVEKETREIDKKNVRLKKWYNLNDPDPLLMFKSKEERITMLEEEEDKQKEKEEKNENLIPMKRKRSEIENENENENEKNEKENPKKKQKLE